MNPPESLAVAIDEHQRPVDQLPSLQVEPWECYPDDLPVSIVRNLRKHVQGGWCWRWRWCWCCTSGASNLQRAHLRRKSARVLVELQRRPLQLEQVSRATFAVHEEGLHCHCHFQRPPSHPAAKPAPASDASAWLPSIKLSRL